MNELKKIIPLIQTPGKATEFFPERHQREMLNKKRTGTTPQQRRTYKLSQTPERIRGLSTEKRQEAKSGEPKRQMLVRSISRGNATARHFDFNNQFSTIWRQEPFNAHSFFTTTYCPPTYHEFSNFQDGFN